MTTVTHLELIENKDLRSKHLDRIEVLEKVKKIVTLSNSKVLHTKLVAEYYEVAPNTIKQLYNRNKEELETNGVITLRGGELREFKGQLQDVTLLGSASAVTLFSTRAVLNVGMLLTESPIALEVRNQILNGYEQTTELQRITLIEEEKDLMWAVMNAPDGIERITATAKWNDFKNRHINELKATIEEQKPKVESFESFISAEGYQTMKQASSSLGIGRNKLYEFLRENKILTGDNIPYQRFINQEYFVVKQITINKGNFSSNKPQTFVTAKGINWINKLLNKNKKDN